MPTTPRHEDMRLDLTLNVTPEGSLGDLPSAVDHAEEDRIEESQPSRDRSQEPLLKQQMWVFLICI